MGMCINCKYHEEKLATSREIRNGQTMFFPRGHYCNNEEYSTKDFVTGESFFANCYQKNAFGECLLFSAKSTESTEDNKETTDENPDKGI